MRRRKIRRRAREIRASSKMTEVQAITVQPDIQYHPDYTKYIDRARRRKASESLQQHVPKGFPEQLSSPLVWNGKDVEQRDDWIYQLNQDQLAEIDAALQHFKGE